MWDEVYSVGQYVYGRTPNGFLSERTNQLRRGSVLCLAEGEGRNAVYLAMHGFTVTAVDSSLVGLRKAEKLAKDNGVEIRVVHADLADFEIGMHAWDSIVSIFCHLPPELRQHVHRGVVAGLKEGGTFLLEAYTPKQLEYGTGGPPSAAYMMNLADLKVELRGLSIMHGVEVIRDVIEGTKHTGTASVVQILAEKA
jgi:SAM-dependent methyltransferase